MTLIVLLAAPSGDERGGLELRFLETIRKVQPIVLCDKMSPTIARQSEAIAYRITKELADDRIHGPMRDVNVELLIYDE